MNDINMTLDERGSTHGSFADQARLFAHLMDAFSDAQRRGITPVQRHALAMIFTKLSRIGVGNPDEVDHWHDIAGYATLVVRELTGKNATMGIPTPPYTPGERQARTVSEADWAELRRQAGYPPLDPWKRDPMNLEDRQRGV